MAREIAALASVDDAADEIGRIAQLS